MKVGVMAFMAGMMFSFWSLVITVIVLEPSVHEDKTAAGYYSYPAQIQDRKDCNENVVRASECVLTYQWIPKEVSK